ncbi:hypothetical protein [Marinobacter sp. CHS3-4]|uniref:hypothetical protein n=1 Tax=Marinobacter sp. CHS3-4 TaxID=3045174 RepID=UPI0024B4FCEA|nr:hypothetical protein [Marinobacter sp. CHS3-4]MDI9244992.1 hypothetical protein [Marinobacter sp. CHS3-4]
MSLVELANSKYLAFSLAESDSDSLGIKYVLTQPFYIRAFTGLAMLIVQPVSATFLYSFPTNEYDLSIFLNSFFKITFFPFALIAFFHPLSFFSDVASKSVIRISRIFLFAGTFSVIFTSMEDRHFMPFYLALICLAIFGLKIFKAHHGLTKNVLNCFLIAWFASITLLNISILILRL